jgi:serine/threonine-protein kinase RsbT
VATDVRISIASANDIVAARQQGRLVATEIGFNGSDLTVIATALSEVARNILEYAGRGQIIIGHARGRDGRRGVRIVAEDEGPGIANVALVMQDGYSTGKGLGLGLPGAKRLMDEFEIDSERGRGTRVTMTKWVAHDE